MKKCREYSVAVVADGKEHIYWSLVESVRIASGPRQRTVVCLGELNESQQKKWKGVANQVEDIVEAMEKQYGKANPKCPKV